MNIDQLAYLCDLQKTGSLSATAERFFITHQGVSKAIRTLENELSTILITRSSKGVCLTADGLFIIEKAKIILEAYQEIRAQYPPVTTAKQQSGELKIACISRILDTYLDTLLTDFTNLYPQINLAVKNLSAREIIQKVSENDAIELGLISLKEEDYSSAEFHDILKTYDLSFTVFSYEEIFACLPMKFKNKSTHEFSTEIFSEHAIISYKYDSPLTEQPGSNLDYEINSIDAQKKLLEKELGIGMVTNREFNKFYGKKKKFTILPLLPPVYFYFGYITSNKRILSDNATAFLELLTSKS